MAGEFPPGSRLDYKKLSAEIGMSTTPVREAVSQLASEGFLELVPRLGAISRRLSREDAVEFFGVREAIETHAAAKAAETISDRQLVEMETLVARMEAFVAELHKSGKREMTGDRLKQFLEADLAFHMELVESANNQRLAKLAANSHAYTNIFGADCMTHSLERVEEACGFHRRVVESLRKGDADKTRRAVAEHLQRSLKLTTEHLDLARRERWWRPGGGASAAERIGAVKAVRKKTKRRS